MTSTTLQNNPLREGLSSARTAEPCTIVIFGASGDLTERMLIPSLFALSEQRLVSPELSVLGISRRPFSDSEFRGKVKPDSVVSIVVLPRSNPSLRPMSMTFSPRSLTDGCSWLIVAVGLKATRATTS